MYIYGTLFFIYGLLIGSFLNVCIYRLPIGMSVAKGRSICPNCRHTLSATDLFPVASYIFLGGKCRYCKVPISPRYAIVELLTAFAFLCAYLRLSTDILQAGILCLLICALICIAFIDYDTREVPDRFHLIILLLGVCSLFLPGETPLSSKIIGIFVVSVPMLLLAMVTGGFGGADIKLMAAIGLYLGVSRTALAFFIAAFIGMIFGLVGILQDKQKAKKAAAPALDQKADRQSAGGLHYIPFCPALCAGIAISIFFSQPILSFYLSLFWSF